MDSQSITIWTPVRIRGNGIDFTEDILTVMTETVKASDIHPDVITLCQQISDEAEKLVAGVESLDANNWFPHADKIDALNSQLQALLLPKTTTS